MKNIEKVQIIEKTLYVLMEGYFDDEYGSSYETPIAIFDDHEFALSEREKFIKGKTDYNYRYFIEEVSFFKKECKHVNITTIKSFSGTNKCNDCGLIF